MPSHGGHGGRGHAGGRVSHGNHSHISGGRIGIGRRMGARSFMHSHTFMQGRLSAFSPASRAFAHHRHRSGGSSVYVPPLAACTPAQAAHVEAWRSYAARWSEGALEFAARRAAWFFSALALPLTGAAIGSPWFYTVLRTPTDDDDYNRLIWLTAPVGVTSCTTYRSLIAIDSSDPCLGTSDAVDSSQGVFAAVGGHATAAALLLGLGGLAVPLLLLLGSCFLRPGRGLPLNEDLEPGVTVRLRGGDNASPVNSSVQRALIAAAAALVTLACLAAAFVRMDSLSSAALASATGFPTQSLPGRSVGAAALAFAAVALLARCIVIVSAIVRTSALRSRTQPSPPPLASPLPTPLEHLALGQAALLGASYLSLLGSAAVTPHAPPLSDVVVPPQLQPPPPSPRPQGGSGDDFGDALAAWVAARAALPSPPPGFVLVPMALSGFIGDDIIPINIPCSSDAAAQVEAAVAAGGPSVAPAAAATALAAASIAHGSAPGNNAGLFALLAGGGGLARGATALPPLPGWGAPGGGGDVEAAQAAWLAQWQLQPPAAVVPPPVTVPVMMVGGGSAV